MPIASALSASNSPHRREWWRIIGNAQHAIRMAELAQGEESSPHSLGCFDLPFRFCN